MCVVWAIGEFYFFFFVFFILTHILLYIEIIIYLIHDMERVVWWRWWERAQTTLNARCLGYRWVLFLFRRVFYTNTYFIVYRGYNTWHGVCWTAKALRKSPNDARLVLFVWAIGEFYFFFVVFFILTKVFIVYIGYNYYYDDDNDDNDKVGIRETSPRYRLSINK